MLEATIRRGTLLAVVVLVVSLLGVVAAFRVPVQMIPDLEVRTISVRTSWPGATPQDVEKEIVIEQEEYLRNVPSLARMISRASTGEAEIELEFPFGIDLNEALIRVNNALTQVPSYPENVDEPRLYTSSFSNNSFIFLRVEPIPGAETPAPIAMMRDFVDDHVRVRLERVPGVSEASIRGGAERQIRIFVDPARLAERGLRLTDVRDRIRERNRDVSGGDLDAGKRRYLLRTVGRFADLEEIGRTILAERGGAILRLRDVARIELGHFEERDRSFLNGREVILLSLRRETGSNVLRIMEDVLPVVAEVNEEVLAPVGLRMAITSDDVRYVRDSARNVWTNLAIGAALATAVMYLFLRSASLTLVGVMAIPVSTIAAFLGLLATGRTINVISLAGVAFAIGMTVDNGIVVLESIERHRRRGLAAIEAAIVGVRGVWPAVLASTATTILVFVPILLIEEEAGQLYADVAVAISCSIFASMAMAIAVLPAATANLARVAEEPRRRGRGATERIAGAIEWLVARPLRRAAVLAAAVGGTGAILVLLTPPAEYLPEGEEAKTFSLMIAPPGYNLTEMTRIARELDAGLAPFLDDEPEAFASGEASVPALAYFLTLVEPERIRVIAETKDPAQIDALMDALDRRFRARPGMRAFSSRGSIISSNDGGTRSVNVDVAGNDLASIYAAALEVYRRAEAAFDGPRINSDPSSLALGQPLVEVRPRWARAAELGFTTDTLGYAVAALSDGAYVDEFYLGGDDKIDVFLYGAEPERPLGDLAHLPVHAPNGVVVPLGAVADLVETSDTATIRRVNGRRTVTLNVIPPRAVALETAVERVRTEVLAPLRAAGALADGVTLEISGASDQLAATREALSGNFLVALALCYLLLVAIFTHWGYPLVIMATVPLGIAGGIGGLAVLNGAGALLPWIGLPAARSQPFDMITMMGFLILLGTVVNNPILIVDEVLRGIREQGLEPPAAVRAAIESRLRPILMSTITTLFGLAPLVFLPGAGTELYRGLGAIVLFGLLFAMVVTLCVLPTLLVTIEAARTAILARGARRAGSGRQRTPMRAVPALVVASAALPPLAQAIDLAGAYELALREDPRIRASARALDAAREERPIARAALLPRLDAGASYGIQHTDIEGGEAGTDEPYDYGLDLAQPIFDWGAIAALRQAGGVAAAAEASHRAEREDLIRRTAAAYFEVLAAGDEIRFARAEEEAVSRQLEQAESRFRIGVAALTDVHEAEARRDLSTATILAAERRLVSARRRLAEIIGRVETELARLRDQIPLAKPEPDRVEAWLEEARERNLALLAAEIAIDVADQEIERRRAGHLPWLGLFGSQRWEESAGFDSGELEERSLSLGVRLPLFAGFGTLAEVRQATSVREQREAEREAVARAVERITHDAYLGVTTGAAEVRALRRAVDSNRTALAASEAGLRVGTRTTVDVLDAQRFLYQAERDHARARYEYLLSVLDLKRAAGRLRRADLLEIDALLEP